MKLLNANKWLRQQQHLQQIRRSFSDQFDAAPLTKRRRLPLFTLATTGLVTTLVYATYLSEKDAALKASMDKIPYLNYLTDPIKEYLSTAKTIIAKPAAILEMIFPSQTTSKAPKRIPPLIPVQESSKVDAIIAPEDKQAEDNSVSVAQDSADILDEPVFNADEPVEIIESVPVVPILPTDEIASPSEVFSTTEENQPIYEEPLPPSMSEPALDLPQRQLTDIPSVPSEAASKGVESSILKQAVADSARELIALRRDLELTLLRDIHLLDENTLRLRIKHVVAELFDRLAWEDLRLTQSLKGVQAELTEKFSDLMSKQRAELEFELRKLLFAQEQENSSQRDASIRELEEKSRKQLNDTIQSQAEGFNSTLRQELSEQAHKIQSELQAQFNNTIALIRKDQVEELLSLQPKVQQVASELNDISNMLTQNTVAVEASAAVHAASSAVLGLELSLVSSAVPIKKHVSSLKSICRGDELVDAVLSSLPDSVLASGALSLSELQVRFNVMRDEVRKDALAPEAAPTIIGQFIGAVLASISIAPSGYVRGPGTEEALARAAYQLERGRLVEALRELDAVQGYGQVLMRDWKKLASDRVAVDQSVKVLKANALLRHLVNKKWIAEISVAIDNKDDVNFASYFQPDGVFRFGNQPEVTGTDGVASYVKAFFGSIESLQHELVALHESKHSDTITWQGRCTYVRLDKHVVTIDFCNILTMEGPLIKTYVVYIDTTPLYAPID